MEVLTLHLIESLGNRFVLVARLGGQMSLFNLPNPDSCICRITNYQKSHSRLFIEIYDAIDDGTWVLSFIGVEYFASPTAWRGSRFEIADGANTLKLLHETKRFQGIPDNYLLEKFRLYQTVDSSMLVSILALNYELSKIPSS
jgi:hypothetical protein